MADEEIRVIIGAQDQTEKGMNDAKNRAQKFAADMERTFTRLGIVSAAAFAGTVAAIKKTTDIGGEFQFMMSRAGAVTNATATEFEGLRRTAADLGAATVYTARQVAEAQVFMGMAGFRANEIIGSLGATLNLAAAGALDMGQAADIMTNIMAGFNLTAEQSGRAADVLTKAFTSSNVNLIELGEAMKFAAPVANSLKISIEETAAAIGLLGNAGIKGTLAGTALRGGLLQMLSPSKEAAALMARYNIQIKDAEGRMLSLTEIIGQMQKGLSGLADAERAAAVEQLVGLRAVAGFLVLLEQGPEALQAFTRELEHAGGTAERIAEEQMDNLKGSLILLESQAEGLALAFADTLSPAIRAYAADLGEGIDRTREWIQQHPEAVRAIATTTTTTTGMIAAVSAAALAWNNMKLAFGGLAGPVGLATVGLSALVGLLVSAATNARVAQEEQERHTRAVAEAGAEYERLQGILDDAKATDEEKKRAEAELFKVKQDLANLMPEVVTRWDEHRQAVELDTEALERNIEAEQRAAKEKQRAAGSAALSGAIQQVQDLAEERTRLETALAGAEAGDRQAGRSLFSMVFPEGSRAIGTVGEDVAIAEAIRRAEARLQALQTEQRRAQSLLDQEVAAMGGMDHEAFRLTGRRPTTADPGSTEDEDDQPPPGTEGVTGPLKAALEDLRDLQALEETPANLRRQLLEVRKVLQEHAQELAKEENLEKRRALERLADITLPQQIAEAAKRATAQDFQRVMRELEGEIEIAELQKKPLGPAEVKKRLEEVRDQFDAFLKANPDLALQMDIRIARAERDLTEEEKANLRKPLEQVQKELSSLQARGELTPELERRIIEQLGLPFALAAGDREATDRFTGRLKELEATLQTAGFEQRFKAIGDAVERAFANAAPQLAELQKQLITAETGGADPSVIAAIKQQMLDLIRPALEAQADALGALLQDDRLTGAQRERVERDLTQVKQRLYDQDLDAFRLATQAKVESERRAAEARAAAERQALERTRTILGHLRDQDMAQLEEQFGREEAAQEARIKGLQRELELLEQQWRAADRLSRIEELRAAIRETELSGPAEEFITADGERIFRNQRLEELQRDLQEELTEQERAGERERLQERISAAQATLASMREQHQAAIAERDAMWANLLALDDEQLKVLLAQTELALGEEGFAGILEHWMVEAARITGENTSQMISNLHALVQAVQEAHKAINSLPKLPEGGGAPAGGEVPGFAHGGYVDRPTLGIFGERVGEYLVPEDYLGHLAGRIARLMPPTLPAAPLASGGGGRSVNIGTIQVSPTIQIPVGTNPAEAQRLVAAGVQEGVLEALEQAARREQRTGTQD